MINSVSNITPMGDYRPLSSRPAGELINEAVHAAAMVAANQLVRFAILRSDNLRPPWTPFLDLCALGNLDCRDFLVTAASQQQIEAEALANFLDTLPAEITRHNIKALNPQRVRLNI